MIAKRKYSKPVNRAWWLLRYLVNIDMSSKTLSLVNDTHSATFLMRCMNVSKPTALQAIDILRTWKMIDIKNVGKGYQIKVNEFGISYYHSHKGYVDDMANLHGKIRNQNIENGY